MRWRFAVLFGVLLFSTGCETKQSATSPGPEPVVEQGEVAPLVPVPASEAPAVETEMVRSKAEAGVGVKGSDLEFEMGTTAAKVYFTARERVVFDMQIPKSMQLYEATNGAPPKTHDEFMKEIIEANDINLPDLPPSHRYVYDPETAELMVEHPK